MKIIDVTTKDQIKLVSKMAYEIWKEHYSKIIDSKYVDYIIESSQSEDVISKKINDGYNYYLAEREKVPVGYFAINQKSDGMYLDKAYVYKEFRNEGVFGEIMRFIEEKCKKLSVNRIYLNVNSNNKNSVEAYKAKGFSILKTTKNNFGSGAVFTDYIMEKILTD